MSEDGLIESWKAHLELLVEKEETLTARFERLQFEHSGIIDFEIGFELVQVRLDIALHGITVFNVSRRAGLQRPAAEAASLTGICSRSAQEAIALFEELAAAAASANVSLESFAGYRPARDTIEALILRGGVGFFEEPEIRALKEKRLVDIVSEAILKYAPPDDAYEPFFSLDAIPPGFRDIVSKVFPFSSAADEDGPPYGIDESFEQSTESIVLPLSQAIAFYETEIIPRLEAAHDSARLQEVRMTLADLKRLSVRPRSRPLIAPSGYYTEGFTRFTESGEPYVPVSLEASYQSGTNVDRIMELVRDEVTRNAAGTGLLRSLDTELKRLKSIESGPHGSRFFPSLRIDTRKWFHRLKQRYPRLGLLADPEAFSELLDAARRGNRKALKRSVKARLIDRRNNGADFSPRLMRN